ncbi:GspH/FimT family protein [Haliea sp.]|uniref:GspH/FimT family protein n=1 Tax=Haliea sp. TaxID=1932666 RepID=UPI0035283B7F
MDRTLHRGPLRGLTLIELLLVVVLLGVLLLVAVPGFERVQQRLEIRAEAGRLFTALHLARSEAVNRNEVVTLCPSAYARSGVLQCAGDYRDGWILLRGRPAVGRLPAAALLRAWSPMAAGLSVLDRAGARQVADPISFRPDGTAGRNRTLMVCSGPHPRLVSWSVVMNVVGRARLVRGWGDCPQAAVA